MHARTRAHSHAQHAHTHARTHTHLLRPLLLNVVELHFQLLLLTGTVNDGFNVRLIADGKQYTQHGDWILRLPNTTQPLHSPHYIKRICSSFPQSVFSLYFSLDPIAPLSPPLLPPSSTPSHLYPRLPNLLIPPLPSPSPSPPSHPLTPSTWLP